MSLDNITNVDSLSILNTLPSIVETDLISNTSVRDFVSNKLFCEQKNHVIKICTFYQLNGFCKFGKRCRYSHNCPKYTSKIIANQTKNDDITIKLQERKIVEITDSNSLMSNNIIPQCESEGNNYIIKKNQDTYCKFYMKGYCRLGRHCRFIHDKEYRSIVRSRLKIESKTKQKNTTKTANEKNQIYFSEKTKLVDSTISKSKRTVEIEQFLKRFPDAERFDSDLSTIFKTLFVPTDPDWPYVVKEIVIQFTLPQEYPKKKLIFNVCEDGVLPKLLQNSIEEEGKKWVDEMFLKMPDMLLIRPMLKWLDNNLENIFTKGLIQLKLERQAEAAGLEFISSSQLKKKFLENKNNSDNITSEHQIQSNTTDILEINKKETFVESQTDGSISTDNVNLKILKQIENINYLSEKKNHENKDILNLQRTGTELSFKDLKFSIETIATISTDSVSLIMSCGRCMRKFDIKIQNQKIESLVCVYCKQSMQCKMRSCLVHEHSHVIGYVDTQECSVNDVILQDCQFKISCLNCSHETIMNTLASGQPNNTWCRNCYKKFLVDINNIKVVKLSPLPNVKFAHLEQKPQVVGRHVKAVKDSAIVDGQPLPNFGICRHFKKSYRWFRFPCCGKAYPCDLCHEEKEDHEMKMANRMICGFCALEQAYSNGKPCSRCSNHMNNKPTSHWEGGKGCRDVIKMSRNDSKKYKGASHSTSNKESNDKTIKIRHSS